MKTLIGRIEAASRSELECALKAVYTDAHNARFALRGDSPRAEGIITQAEETIAIIRGCLDGDVVG